MQQIFVLIIALAIVSEGVVVSRARATNQEIMPAALDMKQQHKTMHTINVQWNKLKQALVKDDLPSAQQAVQKIVDIAPEGAKFKLHRNLDKRDRFLEYQKTFIACLEQLKEAIVARDTPQVKGLVKDVQNACNRCHATFRAVHKKGR